MIDVKIIADSMGYDAPRLTTFELTYPRFIHSELLTHRVFSRNSASSRAIPVGKMLSMVWETPACPEKWVMNEPGMQGTIEATDEERTLLHYIWMHGLANAIDTAKQMQQVGKTGAHKQHINRVLEPWMHIKTVLTGTQWQNFFGLRNHPDAEPTFQVLARKMQEAYDSGTPVHLDHSEWHLPYITQQDKDNNIPIGDLIKVSVARCARTSYKTNEGRITTVEEDIKLADRLLGAQPLHASPGEHQATPDMQLDYKGLYYWSREELHGNLHGWVQYRKMCPNENLDCL